MSIFPTAMRRAADSSASVSQRPAAGAAGPAAMVGAPGPTPAAAAPVPPELLELARVRAVRVKPSPDLTLTRQFLGERVLLRKLRRSNAGLVEAWESVAPPALLERTALRGLAQGVATLGVPDASTRYELDRFLRSGGEKALKQACGAPIRRVKVVIENA